MEKNRISFRDWYNKKNYIRLDLTMFLNVKGLTHYNTLYRKYKKEIT